MDETYIKVKGMLHSLYRVVDRAVDTVDFMLSTNRNTQAAKAFFNKAINANGIPEEVTIDKSDANKPELEELNIEYLFLDLMGIVFFKLKYDK